MPVGAIVGIIVGVVLAIIFGGGYNRLVQLRNQTRNAWSQIDVQLKRRYDLIPNLVETVKGYTKHERETLEAVTKARNMAEQLSSAGAAERAKVEGELTSALGRLLAVVEKYPDLKANQNYLALQEELSSTENRISFARQYYNDSVLKYNNSTQTIPYNVVARAFGFQSGEFFEVTATEERKAPKVSFT